MEREITMNVREREKSCFEQCRQAFTLLLLQHQWLRVPDVPQKGQPHNRDATVGMEPATRRRVQLEYVQLPLDAVHHVHQ